LVLPIPDRTAGVCRQCHGPAAGAYCFCCAVLLGRLGSLAPVVPVGVCPVPGPLHHVLRGYKDAPTPQQRRRHCERLAGILSEFVADHGPCLRRGRIAPTRTVLVPPRPHRGYPWPMARVAHAAVAAGLPPVTAALDWSAGASGHLVASEDAFAVGTEHRRDLRGRGLVLLDDSYTTGATAQSAAQALRRAGAATVVVLVLARIVRPGRSATQQAYWQLVRSSRSGAERQSAPCAAGEACRWADTGA
jgi:predicted amidophosphoribosyltransferase